MKTLISIVAGVALTAAAVSLVAQHSRKDIVDVAAGNKNFSTLVSLVKSAGLVDTLKGTGPFTVLAPTNAAFNKLPKATLKAVGEDKELLTSVLLYHVIPGKAMAADVVKLNGKEVETAGGKKVKITVQGRNVRINNARVTTTDIQASNGVIHVIDTVLIPK
ncbi:MAG: fasciclin domain-containing protein [Fimbriimonadaceae bacterium]|jgi:uncharacterized surface protein with fasciclin (FAS1) repeats|nr:fasciclin domain-containing protein [Fimbriimonadaceae bacterium]